MRELFLTLLAVENAYGYELRQTLERHFGDLLPAMNAGQIYSTLARLERDRLVSSRDVPEDTRGKRIYELTEQGRAELAHWINSPVPGTKLKDEFFMKLVLTAAVGIADPQLMVDVQRREYLQSLRDLDNLLISRASNNATTELLVEGAILHLKADLEWLDMIEQRMPREGQTT
jgi:DNA-binding PadR family transcriptional regulator